MHPLADRPRPGTISAVILAGGRAARLGGIAKPLARVGGTTLLDLAIRAVPTDGATVVVGPASLVVPADVIVVREDPPFGGPVAALAAGVAALASSAGWVLVLAADQPTVGESVRVLLGAQPASDGVIGVDGTARRQPLCALYRLAALREVLGSNRSAAQDRPPHRMMDVAAALDLVEVGLGDDLDVDTADDLRRHGVEVPAPTALTGSGHDRPGG